MTESADVIVLGVGTSGEDVALRLMSAGLDVVGVEPQLIGGECAYWACIPSKFLVRNANLVQEARRADGTVGAAQVQPDWSIIARRLREEVTGGWDDAFGLARFEGKGGRIVRGYGRFVDQKTIDVDGTKVTARLGIVVATGSSPAIPPIPGLADVAHWTTHDAIAAEQLPASLLIVGGGAVGCELGQVYARFGVNVTIVEGMDRLLPQEEPEASAVIEAAFQEEGITVATGVSIASVAASETGVVATLADGTQHEAEHVLLATGRRVDVSGLDLDNAGIGTSNGFVAVDELLRATDGVWAIGDVTGKAMFTHVAGYQANIVVSQILGNQTAPAEYRAVPHATFTDPEVGSVGLTEEAARAAGVDVRVVVKQIPATFRGWLHQRGNMGLVKLVADDDRGVLVGATAVGPHGGEVLGMLSLAIHAEVPLSQMMGMIFAFPTFWGGVGEALGAYGQGVARVLDPETEPMFPDGRSNAPEGPQS